MLQFHLSFHADEIPLGLVPSLPRALIKRNIGTAPKTDDESRDKASATSTILLEHV